MNRRTVCIFVLYMFFFCSGSCHETAFPVPKKNVPYERTFRQDEKKLQQVSQKLRSNVRDAFDSLLPVFNYHYADSSEETGKILSDVQTHMLDVIANSCTDSLPLSFVDACYLLLSRSFFLQNDYDNVRRYLQYPLQNHLSSPYLTEMNLLLLRAETASGHWETVEQLLEKIAYLEETSDTLTGSALEYEMLKSDYLLRRGKTDSLSYRLERIRRQPSLEKDVKLRLDFILGQLAEKEHREKAAFAYYSDVVGNSTSASPLYAYAYVFRDRSLRQLDRQYQDSLLWLRLSLENTQFEPTVVESSHDSAFIYSIYPYYFQDMASRYFLDEYVDASSEQDELPEDDISWYDDNDTTGIPEEMLSAVFENWDSVSIHIPKADFSHLEDTIVLPLVGKGYRMPHFSEVISEFGWRRYRYHYGVDTKNKMGDSIYCLFDGYVRIAKRSRTYGNVIVVRHLNGLETFYAHCSRILAVPNQEVKAGQLIALVGSTGRSTGPHLHLETRYKGVPFNPRYIINFDSARLQSDTLRITKETFNYLKPYGSSNISSVSTSVYYKVKPGDTLSKIASKYHTSVSAIKRLNGLRSDFIRDGQRLRVR